MGDSIIITTDLCVWNHYFYLILTMISEDKCIINCAVIVCKECPRVTHDSCERIQIPAEYSLSQNYPNPFNSTITINSTLPDAGCKTQDAR